MSAATPAPSTPEVSTPSGVPAAAPEPINGANKVILEYLRDKGYKDAEKEFLAALEGEGADKGKQPEASSSTATSPTISAEDLVKALAVYVQKTRPGENALKDAANVLQELASMGNPATIQNLISSIDAVGAEEILSLDPTDKQEGFRELENWVDGSLDMYRVSMRMYLGHRTNDQFALARVPPHIVPHLLSLLPRSYSAWIQGSR